jgi:hypothetical protein
MHSCARGCRKRLEASGRRLIDSFLATDGVMFVRPPSVAALDPSRPVANGSYSSGILTLCVAALSREPPLLADRVT